MKIANYMRNKTKSVSVIRDNLAFDIQLWSDSQGNKDLAGLKSVDDILSYGKIDVVEINEDSICEQIGAQKIEDLKFNSPVLQPGKVFLAAVNYVSHSKEQDAEPPSEPYFFCKFHNAVIGNGDPIIVPKVSKKVDWEVELAVVIGKRGKYISKKDARDYVAGYTIANDVSFRDLQMPQAWPQRSNTLGQNWVKGKGLDNSFPLGPWLVTGKEIKDPNNLELSLTVNGDTKQKSNTQEMVFKIEDLIEYLSAGITLEPGDVISTGTPLGVAVFSGAPFLKDGDKVRASIQGIGNLENPVKSE